jgi:uncharacterized coiled-coil protein SlyX
MRVRHQHYFVAGALIMIAILYYSYSSMERRYPMQVREYLDECHCDTGVSLTVFQTKLDMLEKQVAGQALSIKQNTDGLAAINEKVKKSQAELEAELAKGK